MTTHLPDQPHRLDDGPDTDAQEQWDAETASRDYWEARAERDREREDES